MRTAQLRARFGKKISLLGRKFLNSKLTSSESLRQIGTGKKLAWKCQKGCFKQISEKLFLSLSRRNQPKAKTCPRKKSFKWKRGRILLLPLFGRKTLIEHFFIEKQRMQKIIELELVFAFFVGPGQPGPHQSDLIFQPKQYFKYLNLTRIRETATTAQITQVLVGVTPSQTKY